MLLTHLCRRPVSRRGTVAVMVAVCMILIVAVLALAVDGGILLAQRRHAQTVADAAAMAGAVDLYANYWSNNGSDLGATARASALAVAADNGYTNDGVTSIVTVNIPPTTGDYVGKRAYIEVLVQYNEQRNFSNILGTGPIPIKARAVAIGTPIAADTGILVLDPSAKGALNVQGGGSTVVKYTPVIVNSSHEEAAIAGGGGRLSAPWFYINGGNSTSGGGYFEGQINTGAPVVPDPLVDLPAPDPGAMTVQSYQKIQYTQGSQTLLPGVYRNGISVSGTGSLILQPGIYYMDGGGFSFSGQGSLHGEGVMIYNDPDNGNSAGISVTGQGSVVLHGPDSGIYQNITFFQDRNSDVSANIEGYGGQTEISGTFYFANALLTISGNGDVTMMGSQYISRKLNLAGNGTINIDWRPGAVARKRSIFLVE